MPDPKVTVYGAPWCPDCRRAKQFLGEQRMPYNWVENYPGFSEGIGGGKLADEMKAQTERFGVEILPAQAVTGIEAHGDYRMISTER